MLKAGSQVGPFQKVLVSKLAKSKDKAVTIPYEPTVSSSGMNL